MELEFLYAIPLTRRRLEFISKSGRAKLMQAIAPVVGGKGDDRPDNARGGGKDASKLDEALAKARTLLQ